MLVTSIFSTSHNVFKSNLQGLLKLGLCGKRLIKTIGNVQTFVSQHNYQNCRFQEKETRSFRTCDLEIVAFRCQNYLPLPSITHTSYLSHICPCVFSFLHIFDFLFNYFKIKCIMNPVLQAVMSLFNSLTPAFIFGKCINPLPDDKF